MGYPGESPDWLGLVGGRFAVLTRSATFLYVASSRRFERRPRAEGEAARYGIRPGSQWHPDLHNTAESDPGQILLDRDGSLWLSGFRTLVRYKWPAPSAAAAPREDRFTTEMGLTGDVRPILEDREGNIWVGTDKGLDRFSPPTLQPVLFKEGAFAPLLIPGDQGDVWVARRRHPIERVGRENQAIAALGQTVTAAFRSRDGTLWTAGPDGLFEYAHGVVRKLPLPVSAIQLRDVLDADDPLFQAIAVDGSGALWLSIAHIGLYRWNRRSWEEPRARYGLPPGPAILLRVDPRGRLWIAYPDNQLAIVEGDRVTRFNHAHGLNVGNVLALDVEPTHTWIGGDRGVAVLIGKRFIALRGRGEVDFHMSTGLIETRRGELWLNAAEGIYRIPAAEIGSAVAGNTRLHDTLLQGAQALLFRVQMWEVDPTVPDTLRKEMNAVAEHTKSTIVEGRERILMMRKADAQPADLNESLAAIVQELSLGKGAAFEMKVTGEEKPLKVDVKHQLVDIAREAVRNASQHAGAARVEICLHYGRRALFMSVSDDGGGVAPAILAGKGNPGHFGLLGMRERAKQLGARFRVQSRIGAGTRIEVVIPAGVAFRDAFRWPWHQRRVG